MQCPCSQHEQLDRFNPHQASQKRAPERPPTRFASSNHIRINHLDKPYFTSLSYSVAEAAYVREFDRLPTLSRHFEMERRAFLPIFEQAFTSGFFMKSSAPTMLSTETLLIGMGLGPTPCAFTRSPQKGWSPKKGITVVGHSALRPAAVVPAPPWWICKGGGNVVGMMDDGSQAWRKCLR